MDGNEEIPQQPSYWSRIMPTKRPRAYVMRVPNEKEDGSPVTFYASRALRFAKLSAAVYEKDDDITQASEQEGYDSCHILRTKNMCASVSVNADGIVIAFRGTQISVPYDCARALDRTQQPFGEEGGTQQVQKSMADVLDETVTSVNGEDVTDDKSLYYHITHAIAHYQKHYETEVVEPQIYFVGHSVGGSVACVCAAQWLNDFPEQHMQSIYTFGQTRVGNRDFSYDLTKHDRIDGTYYRVATENDPMVLIPAKYTWGSNCKTDESDAEEYKHGGIPILISDDGQRVRRPKSVTQELLNGMAEDVDHPACTTAYKNPRQYLNVPEHRISHYVDALAKLLEKERAAERDDRSPERGA